VPRNPRAGDVIAEGAYRLDDVVVPDATRIEGAAIFTSTCSIGFLVQACVT
jgi:hypothetical protein